VTLDDLARTVRRIPVDDEDFMRNRQRVQRGVELRQELIQVGAFVDRGDYHGQIDRTLLEPDAHVFGGLFRAPVGRRAVSGSLVEPCG
jgi:hypothetical protein